MNLHKEKLEEMRQNILIEQKLHKDFDYAIEYLDQEDKLNECIKYLEKLSIRLSFYGWEITPKEIIERIM